jgi:hypothetical protein
VAATPTGLERLAVPWRERVGLASRRALGALGIAVVLGLAHLARLGTPLGRAAVGALLATLLLLLTWRSLRERRSWDSVRITIARVLGPTDRALAARTLRALALAERSAEAEFRGSRDLARYHFERLLARASVEAVTRTAQRHASRWRWAGLLFWVAAVLALLPGPARVAEGLDVLVALRGRALWPMSWLDETRVSAEPPGYLRLSDRDLAIGGVSSELPVGSVLTVRGVPLREGRHIVLTDGAHEVPFVSDGSGGLVARWSVERGAVLRVAARFGEVLITEDDPIEITARPDEPPVVELEGAPRTVPLRDVDRLKLLYSVADDHGLRQVDLVLRAGGHEERRVLVRLSGETTVERGGTALTAKDPFLRRMFLPVQVTIEARDNDPLAGPKWGQSQIITIVPPAVGQPEAARYAALQQAHELVLDWLAAQTTLRDTADRPRDDRRLGEQAARSMRSAVEDGYSGLTVPEGLASFLLGQMRVLVGRPPPGASVVRQTEDVILAVDVALRALAERDARSVAKRLADVAEEAADGARQARETDQRALGESRLDAALRALEAGGTQLSRLGDLGADLGSVALSELGRIRRARVRDDLMHAQLAARHLAARLRRPEPSAAAVRGSGTETAGSGGPAAWGDPSHADDRFDELQTELGQLAEEHAREIDGVARALSEAEQALNLEQLEVEAKQRADALRRSVAELPLPGAEPGSARAAAALGREHAASMAQSLERLSFSEAVQSGRDAVAALEDAQRRAREQGSGNDWVDPAALREAREQVATQLAWAESMLRKLREEAEGRARGALRKSGSREQQFAQRAGNLAGRGRISETALPDEVVQELDQVGSLMREAARALLDGHGERGLELQREAQRLLEHADQGRTSDGDSGASDPRAPEGDRSAGRGVRTDGTVPDPEHSRGSDDFRKRVLDGLGQERGGRLAPAIKRYAEGLLR